MKYAVICLMVAMLVGCAGVVESPEPIPPRPSDDSAPPPADEPAGPSAPPVPAQPPRTDPAPALEEEERVESVDPAVLPGEEPAPAPDAPVQPRIDPAPADQPRFAPEPVEREAEPEALPEDAEPDDFSGAIGGRITVTRNNRPMAGAATFLNQTIVAWKPDNGPAARPMEERQIVTRSSRFFPQTMAVTSGTSVRFPNMDSIEHNVFSLTPGHQFDVGMYGEGEGASNRFIGSGVVELFCNIHPNMAAFVLVLETPFFVSPDADGRFDLEGLPEGPGQLLVWNYRAEEPLQRINLNLDGVAEVAELGVDITRPAVPQHTNKHGEPYRQR